ncbi:hypothetical protein JTE90_016661 [Oedothorax gibbosus]|uniref:Cytochrome c oxidase subunit 5B, mitochondrial n=1 Tax=Oedothorax gibbosus TaxID=931172 RepID=A0AAV6V600_9ARAC|nr:hypothetical protein JTE90_016661 [Oedothorax gibbosus]
MALMVRHLKTPLRFYRTSAIAWNKVPAEKKLPHYIEHSTGLERKELLARAAGNDDPFSMNVQKRGPGTKDNPNLVPSYESKRIIGCICEEEATSINWMWVHQDEMRRCYCGHYFKLVEAKPFY